MKASKYTTVALSSIVLLAVLGTQVLAWPPGCLPEECEYWDGYYCVYNCSSCQECEEGECIDTGCDCTGTGECCGACCGACCEEGSDSSECGSCPSEGGGGWGLGDELGFAPPGVGLPGRGLSGNLGFATAGDPVFVRTGEFKLYATDLLIDNPGLPIVSKRTYSNRHHRLTLFGYNWDMNYNMSVREIPDEQGEIVKVQIFKGDACTHTYERPESGGPVYESDSDPGSYVQRFDNGMGMVFYTLHKKNGRVYVFYIQDEYQLGQIVDPEYGVVTFGYDGNRLQTISDGIHGTITVYYNYYGLVEAIGDSSGRTWWYLYDEAKDMILAVTPNGLATTYVYDDNHNMTSVYDPNGDLVVGNVYDVANDRVWMQAVGTGFYQFEYDAVNNKTTVTDREGHTTEMVYNGSGQLLSRKVFTDPPEEVSFTVTYSYNEETLRRTRVLYPRGNCIDYTYDDKGNLTGEYKKTDTAQPNERGDPDVVATTYTYYYDDTKGYNNKVHTITDPEGNVTTYEYYDSGDLKKITYPPVERPAPTRSFTYADPSRGRVATETGMDGIVTKYEYYLDNDSQISRRGKLHKVIKDYGTEPGCLNLTTEYDYDNYGNIASVKDPKNNTWTYEEEWIWMTKVRHEHAPQPFNQTNVTSYYYDYKGNVNQITRSTGGAEDQVTSYLYSGANNLAKVTNPLTYETHYCYDKSDQLNKVFDAEGYTTETEYNERGLVTQVKAQVTETEYEITLYEYNQNGNLTKMTDPRGKMTTYEYDLFDRLTKVTDPVGHFKMYEYDKLGNVVKETAWEHRDPGPNAALMQTRTEYDALGRVTRRAVMANASSSGGINTSVDQVVDYGYNLVQRKSWVRTYYNNSSTPATTAYENDRAGRLARVEDPAGNETVMTYYADDRLESLVRTDQNPLEGPDLVMTTEFEYDNLGRITLQKEKENENTWQITTFNPYDRLDNLLQKTTPDGVITAYGYDLASQIETQIADFGGEGKINQTTGYTYDDVGRIDTLTGYADGSTAQRTTYEYDGLGRVKKITYPDTEMIQYEYWPGGRVQRRTDQRGIVTDYAYDDNSNLLRKTVTGNDQTDDALETFTYDGLGRMLSGVKTVAGYGEVSSTEFAYTGIGKIDYTDETLFDGPTFGTKRIDYGYDQAGFRTQTIYPEPWPTASLAINVIPDWQGRIATLKVNNETNNRVQYDYIGSRVKRRTYRPTVVVSLVCDTGYDNLGRVTEIKATRATTTPVQFGYEYQPDTKDIWKQTYVHRNPQNPPQVQFTYDNLDRLTSASYGMDSTSESFYMDKLGNRYLVTLRDTTSDYYAIDSQTNRYASIDSTPLLYDSAGNLTEDRQDYTYHYDYENRLVKIRKSGDTVDVAEFFYDALGRRICKVDWLTETGIVYYNNDNWQVLCEYDAFDGAFEQWYAYGNYIDEVLIKGTFYAASSFQYYLHDHLYSPVAITSWLGTPAERYEYDAYGNPHALDPTTYAERPISNSLSRYLFTGRELDIFDYGSLKIQYNRNRYYDSYTGRWTTQDPKGYSDGLNLYQYARSNPLTTNDPMGLIPGADGDVGYGWTPERCEQMRDRRAIELGSGLAHCLGVSAGPISRDTAFCVGICVLASSPSGEATFRVCLAGCTGFVGALDTYILGRCMELHEFHRQSTQRSYNYCMCRADGCSIGDCVHHLDYEPPRRRIGRRIIDRIVDIVPFFGQ